MKKIKLVIQGGLGNQLFQLSYMLDLQSRLKCTVEYSLESMIHDPIRELEIQGMLSNLGFSEAAFPGFFRKNKTLYKCYKRLAGFLFSNKFIVESIPRDGDDIFELIKRSNNNRFVIVGYFQSIKHVNNNVRLLRQAFFDWVSPNSVTLYYKDLIDNSNASVFLHVRRGDYVSSKSASDHHGVCGTEYYTKAIKQIKCQAKSVPTFFIFSDEISWCKSNLGYFGLSPKDGVVFIEREGDVDSLQDMYLMSLCGTAVMANSTYSWWGTQLNSCSQGEVFCPSKWFISGGAVSIYDPAWSVI